MKTVIPERITDFNRTDEELESYLLFALAVAGKNADSIAPKINQLVQDIGGKPFHWFRQNRHLIEETMLSRAISPYKKMIRATNQILDLNLRTCTREDLEAVYGIGPKTSRFFLLHSRPAQEMVVLDIHVLRFLKKEFRMRGLPDDTPSGQKYLDIEKRAIRKFRERYPDKTFAEIDLKAWLTMRAKGDEVPPAPVELAPIV